MSDKKARIVQARYEIVSSANPLGGPSVLINYPRAVNIGHEQKVNSGRTRTILVITKPRSNFVRGRTDPEN